MTAKPFVVGFVVGAVVTLGAMSVAKDIREYREHRSRVR